MKINVRAPSLRAASSILLAISTLLLLLVAERAVSAIWQWYKFHGYDTAGVITLSKSAGIAFFAASIGLTGASLFVRRVSVARQDPVSARVSMWAVLVLIFGLGVYIALALSPLNVWRR